MALIFFASSRDELALVEFITAAVVSGPVMFCELLSNWAVAVPIVAPIRLIDDDKMRIHRKFFITDTYGNILF